MNEMILVTGCADFIDGNFVLTWLNSAKAAVINLDRLARAGNLANLEKFEDDPRHVFVQGDIGNRQPGGRMLSEYRPRAVISFAAESHVDRSIHGPRGIQPDECCRHFQFAGISWPINTTSLISDKDRNAPALGELGW